jgi:hypothetical protein
MLNAATRSWRMLLPLAAVLLLAVLWTVYWFVAAGAAKARFTEERTKLAAQGVTLACTEEDWGGYPFHFEFACNSPVLRLENRLEVKSAELLLTALAYAPWQIVALLNGPSTFIPHGVPPTTTHHQRAIAAVTFDHDWKPKLSAEIPALSIPGRGTAEKVMLHTRPSAGGGTDVAISAREVNYEPPGRPALVIGMGEFLASLSPERTLKVERITLEQDAVRYWGSGSLGLDEAHRPSGKLDTQTNDLDGLLKLLEPHLDLTEEQKSGLRAMLGLLGNEAKAPLIAQEGALYLGPFKIADLPPLY